MKRCENKCDINKKKKKKKYKSTYYLDHGDYKFSTTLFDNKNFQPVDEKIFFILVNSTESRYCTKFIMHTQLAIQTHQSGLLTWFLKPLMLCMLILYISGATYSLRSSPNDRFFLRNFS